MTTNQKVISWRWHQRQANPSEGWQSVDALPCVVPGEVPGGPRHILHASALRLRVLVTRTERSLGPTALNHTPPPTYCHDRQRRLMQKHWLRSYWSNPLVCFGVALIHILLFQLIQWSMMLLWHFPCFWEHPNVNKALQRVNDSS